VVLGMISLDSKKIARKPYLFSVSSGASKLFWLFNSAMSASLRASSLSVGKVVDIGGVMPH